VWKHQRPSSFERVRVAYHRPAEREGASFACGLGTEDYEKLKAKSA